ncbi:hypothetical protein LNA02_15070 [Levilactobacillus namurensis]|nr:hypothetical protein LNA02_15070 [Levilactobacillus namurensis]
MDVGDNGLTSSAVKRFIDLIKWLTQLRVVEWLTDDTVVGLNSWVVGATDRMVVGTGSSGTHRGA